MFLFGGEDEPADQIVFFSDLWMLSLVHEPRGWVQLKQQSETLPLGRR
jgi:hypothetical protein